MGYAATEVIAGASNDFHVIMAGRSLVKVNSAKSEIEAGGVRGTLSTLQLNVTDEKSIQQAVSKVEQDFGRLDPLMNNAGVASIYSDVKSRSESCMVTNAVGPTMVAVAFRPLLSMSQRPYSIYVSGVVGSLGLASDPSSQLLANPFPNGES